MADATQIHQVIVNLCTNAWHAMEDLDGHTPKTGSIKISLLEIEWQADAMTPEEALTLPTGPYACLTVTDTGCGMDEATMSRIFDPFYTTKATDRGTGLGLSVVHGIVQSHQGEITVSSQLNEGTTFRVYLPIVNVELPMTKSPDATVTGGEEKIVVVDDNAAVAAIVNRILTNLGYQVTVFEASESALTYLLDQTHACDLLLTDLTMPTLTGLQLAKKVISSHPDLPVILMTGHDNERLAEKENDLKAINIQKVLRKPLTKKVLAGAIREALDQKSDA